jgi:hypothetical protein
MAELGSGNGSDYPSSLDTDNTLESTATTARPDVPNDLAAAIVAIENELGTTPSGTKSDVKTYLQTEHATDGTHAAITPTSITSSGAISGTTGTFSGGTKTDGTNLFKTTVLAMGEWNMNGTGSGAFTLAVAHGLGANYKKIRGIDVIIRDDADSNYYDFTNYTAGGGSGLKNGGITTIDTTNITLSVTSSVFGGAFDSSDFDSTSLGGDGRGWLLVTYTV